jgi:hypothetical protein
MTVRPAATTLSGMSHGGVASALLAAAWSEVLSVPAAPDADFYVIGGDSLDAMRIATAVADGLPQVPDLDVLVMTEILDRGVFSQVEGAVLAHLAATGSDG